jgi:hypothetical protein
LQIRVCGGQGRLQRDPFFGVVPAAFLEGWSNDSEGVAAGGVAAGLVRGAHVRALLMFGLYIFNPGEVYKDEVK